MSYTLIINPTGATIAVDDSRTDELLARDGFRAATSEEVDAYFAASPAIVRPEKYAQRESKKPKKAKH